MWWNIKDDDHTKTKMILNKTSETLFKKKRYKITKRDRYLVSKLKKCSGSYKNFGSPEGHFTVLIGLKIRNKIHQNCSLRSV